MGTNLRGIPYAIYADGQDNRYFFGRVNRLAQAAHTLLYRENDCNLSTRVNSSSFPSPSSISPNPPELRFWVRITLSNVLLPGAPFPDSSHRTSLSAAPPPLWAHVPQVAREMTDTTPIVVTVVRVVLVIVTVKVSIYVIGQFYKNR